jgi:hypothetical protein
MRLCCTRDLLAAKLKHPRQWPQVWLVEETYRFLFGRPSSDHWIESLGRNRQLSSIVTSDKKYESVARNLMAHGAEENSLEASKLQSFNSSMV